MLCDSSVVPHAVLGDFDSLDERVRDALCETEFVHALDQEASDLDKAIAYAVERGATRITVTGAGGGLIDHVLSNVSILLRHHPSSAVRIVEDGYELQIIHESAEFAGLPGDTLSLICFEPVEGVTAEGVKWPLRDETLYPGSRGVSNELAESVASIWVRNGILIASHIRCG
jgi:thiamine pyrophosphokinase